MNEGFEILRTLNKLSGAVAGALLYPLKSLLVNAMIAAALLIVTILAALLLPLLTMVVSYRYTGKPFLALFLGVGIFFVSASLFCLLGPLIFLGLAIAALADIRNHCLHGIRDGYAEGIAHVARRALMSVVLFSRVLQIIVMAINQHRMTPEGLAALRGASEEDFSHFQDVPRPPNPVPDLTGDDDRRPACRDRFIPLTSDEVSRARGICDLKTVLDQYLSLYERLNSLDKAMTEARQKGDSSLDFDDELCIIQIRSSPSLLLKQYEDSPSRWKVVPASTLIIDSENLNTWLRNHTTHPTTRESMKEGEATLYQEKKTRYRYYAYQTMADSHELRQAAGHIRDTLASLRMENLPPAQDLAEQVASEARDRVTALFAPVGRGTVAADTASSLNRGNQP